MKSNEGAKMLFLFLHLHCSLKEVQGYTPQSLVKKRGFNPMNAFLTMDWLLREPDKAVRRLRRDRDYFLVSDEMKAKYEQRKEECQRRKWQNDELK